MRSDMYWDDAQAISNVARDSQDQRGQTANVRGFRTPPCCIYLLVHQHHLWKSNPRRPSGSECVLSWSAFATGGDDDDNRQEISQRRRSNAGGEEDAS